MADSYKCQLCGVELTCSCNSMECSFDYDIAAHTRRDVEQAIERLFAWHKDWDLEGAMRFLTATAKLAKAKANG